MAWLCLKDDVLSGSQMCIVTGPRIDLAIGNSTALSLLLLFVVEIWDVINISINQKPID
jgi:hypothetical protein